ncbi:saccharopine dehydrogenase NADP-binding domain-containing protein [Carboxylicivirga mesophila]|uniref:Saccharopine dehydrogenase NADP-binding domain-containing protein n=1 Tax=Carboxylicivirga mesophila TaxID=1166478 RepID=A0ABS5K7V2_9BACT|nr:saccharopine dehydrogenase C-terminal domain-containing protein [Carboxylicivirga mesophila]MBS2210987.1 saccharopine dehydrogenase NADP-binding domain-containing protein [Carboxylicivirga mesophila]
MIKNIAVVGLGKVGSLVAILLNKSFNVHGFDSQPIANSFSFQSSMIDITEREAAFQKLKEFDAVVSCLPYKYNIIIAQIAHQAGIHYFDLTEDIKTSDEIMKLSATSKGIMAPQCGLAPGYIGIVGYDLVKRFDKLRDVELRVGALPRYPNGLLGYSFNWSPAGVINEYIEDAEVITNGKRKYVSSLMGLETINIEGREYEAFYTSGGLGTLCKTLDGKVDTLNYKTIRYPGHARLMRFLITELILKDKKEVLEDILTIAKPPVKEDVVYVYAAVEGWQGDKLFREEFFHTYLPQEIDGQEYRAISWTTASSVCSVVELVHRGVTPSKGYLKQEDINLDDFLSTSYGKYYKNQM